MHHTLVDVSSLLSHSRRMLLARCKEEGVLIARMRRGLDRIVSDLDGNLLAQ